jgi:hypothetical protein
MASAEGIAMNICFDRLSSTQFEEFSSELLHAAGYVNIDWRKGRDSRQVQLTKGSVSV